jgi:hypothetical protein
MDNPNTVVAEGPKKSSKILLFFFLAVLVLSLSVGIIYVYQYAGLNYYINAYAKVQKLPEPNKSKAILNFYNNQDGTTGYRGILAGVTTSGSGGIWVWGRSGLKYFYNDKDSIYLFTDGCIDAILNPKPSDVGKTTTTNPEVYTDLARWSQRVKTGDFVIVKSRTNIGLFEGNAGSVLDYNWWNFLGSDMKTECAR